MTDILRIKRRAVGGAAGPPSSLIASEVAFNEQDNTLYYGKGNSGGVATSIIPIAGSGAFLPLAGGRLSGGLSFGSITVTDPIDTSRHISLFDGWGGFTVTGGSLNVVAGGALQMSFYGSSAQMRTGISLFLDHDPTAGGEAATKSYVDNFTTRTGGPWLPLVGGMLSGPLHINASATGNPTLFLANYTNGSNTNWPAIVFDRSPNHPMSGYFESDVNGLPRWSIDFGNPDPETGGNTGTNFDINRFDDAGHVLSPSPFVITRATGTVTIATPLMLGGDPTVSLQAATKSYVDNFTTRTGGPWLPLAGGTVTGNVSVTGSLSGSNGLYFSGGNYQPGVIYTDANFGCLIRGRSGAIYDVALADNAGSWWVGLSAGGLLSVTGPASFSSTVALATDPTTALQAATKQYVDNNTITPAAGDARWVNVTGDTMSGQLTSVAAVTLNYSNSAVRPNSFSFHNANTGVTYGMFGNDDTSIGFGPTNAAGVPVDYWLTVVAPGDISPRGTIRLNTVNSDQSSVNGGIQMYPGFGGFGVTAGTLNYNWTGTHQFLQGATPIMQINGGLNMQTPLTVLSPTADQHAASKQYVDNNTITPAAGDARWVNVNGDTMTAALQIGTPTGTGTPLLLTGAAGTQRAIQFRSDSRARWMIECQGLAETGGGVGGDFLIDRYDDSGAYVGTPFLISRATGGLTLGASSFSNMSFFNAGLTVSGGDFSLGSIYTDGNWGFLIRGRAGAIADAAIADSAGNIPLRIKNSTVLLATTQLDFDPTSAMQAVTKQYSDRNKQRGLVDVTSNAASPSVSDVDWGYLYVYGSPTAPSTITMPVATTVRVLWTVNNVTSQPTTIRGASGGTVTIPSGASQAVWTDTGGIYALYNAGATRTAGDNSTYWATTAFVQGTAGNYLPLVGGTITGQLTVNSSLAVYGGNRSQGWLIAALNTGTPPAPDGALYMGWNFSQGGGESFFFNSYTSAATSFNFHQLTGPGTSNRLMSMLSSGSLSLVGNIRFEGNAPAINDLSKHIALNSTTGFNVWGTQLNSVVPTGGYFNWTIGTASVGYLDATGINYLPIGATGAAAGTFTTLTTSGVVRLNNGVGIAYDGNNYIKFEWAGVVKVHVDGNNYVANIATQDWVSGYYLPLAGGSLSGGLHFGSATSPGNSPTDTSRHITLYDTGYGFSITGGTLNIVAGINTDVYTGNTLASRMNGSGLQMFAGSVTLLGDPTSALQAATKQYVDRATSAFVTVMQYGATGNGTADDTAAINAALSSGAKAVFFPLGTYKVSGVLTLPTNVMAWGLGGGSNIVTNQATGDVMRITGGGTEVVGLTFTSSVTRSGGSFINLTSTGVCKIRECFGYGAFVGITVSAGPTYILNCYFRETVAAGTVIAVTGGFNIRIRGCFHDTSTPCQYGIRLTGNIGDVAIGDCDFIHSGICLSVEANAGQEIDSVWVHDTFFDTSSFGIKMVATSGLIRRCQFNQVWTSSHTQVGFDMETGGTGAEINGIEIHGHHAFLNANAGLLIKDSGVQNVRVTGSNYAGNAPGISVGLNCSAFAIHGCNCSSYSGIGGNTYGIAFLNGCDNFYIQNCNLEGNSVGPVFLGTPAGTAGYTWWVSDNLGFHTLGKGSFTLPANNLNATISHGLSMPATVNDVQTWALSGRQNITNWWVDNVTATTFRFNCYSAATIDTFWAWEARINGQ